MSQALAGLPIGLSLPGRCKHCSARPCQGACDKSRTGSIARLHADINWAAALRPMMALTDQCPMAKWLDKTALLQDTVTHPPTCIVDGNVQATQTCYSLCNHPARPDSNTTVTGQPACTTSMARLKANNVRCGADLQAAYRTGSHGVNSPNFSG